MGKCSLITELKQFKKGARFPSTPEGIKFPPRDTDEELRKYIQKQKDHHKKVSFQDEYRSFLQKYGIDYDEKYVWD